MERQTGFLDIKLFYEVTGKGKPVILLHGFCEDHTWWSEWKILFEPCFQILIPDLLGFGKTGIPSEKTSIPLMAESVIKILEAEKIHEAVVVGHSMGGYVAIELAKKYPGKIKGLGLFHSSAWADEKEKKIQRKKSIGFIARNGSAPFVKELYAGLFSEDFISENPDFLGRLHKKGKTFSKEAIMNAQQAMLERPDLTSVLKAAKFPVQFIFGKKDERLPFPAVLRQVLLPEICFIKNFENVGHMGMFEAKSETQKAVLEFVSFCFSK